MDKRNEISRIKLLVFVAIMSSISAVLMIIDFPLFFSPSFMKMDISELPAVFNSFYIGPVASVVTIILKVLIKLVFKPTSTAYVGELVNVFAGVFFVLPAGLIYKKYHTKGGAIVSLIVSTLFSSILITIINAYVTFPMYGELYGLSTEKIVSIASKINPFVKNNLTLISFSVLPFNIIKYTIISIITFFIYNKMHLFVRKHMERDGR